MSFDSLLGNEQLKSGLTRSLAAGHASHFYLISGPQGSGKHSLARLLSAALVCRGENAPCMSCPACRKALSGAHPDVITVDDPEKKTVSVSLVRQAKADIYVRPNEAPRKVYIFPRAQDMGLEGQNALLKVLEEPPEYGVFLLLTDNPQKLLPTVRSRCAALRFNTEAEEEDEEIAAAAEEYLECLKSGSSIELLTWCVSHENMERADVVSFFGAVKQRCADMLCGRRAAVWEDKKCIMDIIMLSDKCLERLKVNTGVKQIFGLLAVKSLPAKETRK